MTLALPLWREDCQKPTNPVFPELFLATSVADEKQTMTFFQADEDAASSIYNAPSLPGTVIRPQFITNQSEEERTVDDENQVGFSKSFNVPLLCADSEAEAEDETEPAGRFPEEFDFASTSAFQPDRGLHEISGRSRALLKKYFEKTPPFSFPVGHPTVPFSEPQMYHLLRILTNETVRVSLNTMEVLILDALKGTPTPIISRTEQFQTQCCPQTPRLDYARDPSVESSSEEFNRETDNTDAGLTVMQLGFLLTMRKLIVKKLSMSKISKCRLPPRSYPVQRQH